jgi:hypothetical protein
MAARESPIRPISPRYHSMICRIVLTVLIDVILGVSYLGILCVDEVNFLTDSMKTLRH